MGTTKGLNRRLATAALMSLGATLFVAAPGQAQGINVTVNGEVINFTGQSAMERNGSVLVPLRGVFEKLGAQVLYDGVTKNIVATKGATTVQLTIGQTAATVNGQPRTLSYPAMTVGGTTLVPLRFVSEALGADVRWSGASRTVIITTGGSTPIAGDGTNTSPPANSAPSVTALRHSAERPLRAGETLSVTLTGTPGAEATFSVPGIPSATNLPMRESSAGTYVGEFTLPKGVNIREASVLAQLKRGGFTSPTLQAAQPLTVDGVGPTLGGLSPAPGSAVAPGKTLIYGTLSDAGTGVGSEAVRLTLNGKDVTDQATVTESFFSFRPSENLPLGKNTVAVTATDAAGNETRKSWDFNVSAAEALVDELTFTPADRRLEPGDVMTVQLKAKPNGTARYSVGTVVKDRPLREQSPGVYVGTYTVKKGDSLNEAPVSATYTRNGRTVTVTAGKSIAIAAGAPDKPTITFPTSGQNVGSDTVTFKGKAAPNSTVRYHVKYAATVLLLSATGTLTDGEVKADAQGNWVIAGVRLSAPPGIRNITYTLEIEAVGAAGEASETVSVEFKK